jgi:hypothetical protein
VEGLGDDLGGGEVAGVTHLAGGAEDAAHGAADLGADAGGGAAAVAHEHGLDAVGVVQAKQVFAGEAVGGVRLLGGDGKIEVALGEHAVEEAGGHPVVGAKLGPGAAAL